MPSISWLLLASIPVEKLKINLQQSNQTNKVHWGGVIPFLMYNMMKNKKIYPYLHDI